MKTAVFVALVLLAVVYPAAAQSESLPDVSPIANDVVTGVESFLTSAGVIMGLISVIVIQALKYVLPENRISTSTIYGAVVSAFAVIYILASQAGITEQLQAGVDFLTALAGPVWQIILLFFTGPVVYKLFKTSDNPVLGRKQGKDPFSFE